MWQRLPDTGRAASFWSETPTDDSLLTQISMGKGAYQLQFEIRNPMVSLVNMGRLEMAKQSLVTVVTCDPNIMKYKIA